MTARRRAPRLPEGWEVFYRVVRAIPRGKVLTYGGVAERAGRPRSARHVGFALAALRDAKKSRGVPWQRVLGARGRGFAGIAIRDPIGAALQRELLESESVEFDDRDRVDLSRFEWKRRGRAG
jgi:methylated-DNA-protein-cysteine methyltransferase-like protein